MDAENAKEIILNAVETTEPTWRGYNVHWDDIDEVFLTRAYEIGGFHLHKFVILLQKYDIYSIESLGSILDNYKGERKYQPEFSRSIDSPFFQGLRKGQYGLEGEKFFKCVEEFKGNFGNGYWRNLWWMLICNHYLKKNYNSSFSFFLKTKYGLFKGLEHVSDSDFINMSFKDWEGFIKTHPWDELYGVGENIFNYLMRDIEEFNFVDDSEKLDLANEHFLKVTGIMKESEINRQSYEKLLKSLNLPFSISQVNKGLYCYCSDTEAHNYGFCRKIEKCTDCDVDEICEKNFG